MKRLALLAGLTLALATPAHAGKKKNKAPDLTEWITLAQDMGVRVQAGQLRVDDPALALKQAYGFLRSNGLAVEELDQVADLAFTALGVETTKKKKKRRNKNKGQASSDGVHRVANARR